MAQTCIDFNDFTSPISHYNNLVSYPDKSILYQVGDIKMKNGNDASHPFNPTVLDSIKSGYIPFGERLFFKGSLVIDVSDFPSECKKVRIAVSTDSIFIDSYLIHPASGPTFPFDIGDSIRIEADMGLVITGKFNRIRLQPQLVINPQGSLDNFCLEACSGEENCEIDFEYNVTDSIIDFTNLSSIGPSESDLFMWNSSGRPSSVEENPTYIIPENGKHEFCLTILNSMCFLGGPTLAKCDSVEINIPELDFIEENEHFTLTPNDDGVQDYIDLEEGTKIFDRNGLIIIELIDDLRWTGTTSNGTTLRTSLYTILLNGKTSQITLIR